jgi:hypothetical protein
VSGRELSGSEGPNDDKPEEGRSAVNIIISININIFFFTLSITNIPIHSIQNPKP